MSTTIADAYNLCIKIFYLACDSDGANMEYSQAVPIESMRNELARLQLWGDDLEIDSLDLGLYPGDHLKMDVLEHLMEIVQFLSHQMPSLLRNEQHMGLEMLYHWKKLCMDANIRKNAGKAEISDSDSVDFDDDLEDAIELIGFRTTCLLELSPILEQLIEARKKAERSEIDSELPITHGYAFHYSRALRDRFPEASQTLLDRLGQANEQRHRILRERHAKYQSQSEHIASLLSKTVASQSAFHDSGIGTTESANSVYPRSNTSLSSFASSKTQETAGLRVPPAPKEVIGRKAFKATGQATDDTIKSPSQDQRICPLCQECSAQSQESFIRHLAQHLEEIALMALPPSYDEDSDYSSCEDDDNRNEKREYTDKILNQTTEERDTYAGLYLDTERQSHEPDLPDTFLKSQKPSASSTQKAILHCLAPRCTYQTDRLHDLKRHKQSSHDTPEDLYKAGVLTDCPYDDCGHVGKNGFKRKDHLRDHTRRWHMMDLPKEMGGTGKKVPPPSKK
ncbi:uncharacterized protein KY384_004599 [Bacidia gigantensis]|uniref:uncharacterized protein n=1 Tax=Bacidia gigantensis TaxID=2732470 RepID=UPI001D04B57B|nr:uncharacterized protein KY384_004599 [Bacidia gigantensis]KAG8531241.1 hypothetical protein KY384_004599 [Bacidia gigantensis]